MKKLFTLLCLALTSAAVFAQDAYDPNEHTAFVSGTANLCAVNEKGQGWQASDEMTYDSEAGLWKITLAAKDTKVIEFKIVYDGEWYGDESGNNYQFQVSEASDVLITFDPNTLLATYDGDKVKEYDPNAIEYVVAAGSAALLNGKDWTVDAEENKLTEIEAGYYELELKGVAAGTYEFKFAANGAWATQWGAVDGLNVLENGVTVPAQGGSNPPNFKFTLDKGYTYDVTLTLDNMDSANPKVSAAWTQAGTADITDDIYSIAGTMNDWNQADVATEMTKGTDGTYSYTFTALAAGNYEFKVVVNHDWGVCYGGAACGQESDNACFSLTETSDVTITFDPSATSLSWETVANDTDAIQSVNVEKANGAIYNIAGQRVSKATRGLYIINGKKVLK